MAEIKYIVCVISLIFSGTLMFRLTLPFWNHDDTADRLTDIVVWILATLLMAMFLTWSFTTFIHFMLA